MEKTESLRMNYMFRRIYARGRVVPGRYMVLYAMENGKDINRLGITTSRKVGKSVKRNRIRRIIRESYRQLEDKLKSGYDLVFVVRSLNVLPNFWDVQKEMVYLFGKCGIIVKEIEE